ncbi:MAG: HpcH/HpaI aldolase family protein [Christensenellales bacterium]|jgi:4-hydroxy-2-oxoheptanedioate aldolase
MNLYENLHAFKEKLSTGQPVTGPFMKTGDPAFVEAAGWAGFDFCILDTEHGPVSIETMQNNVRAAEVSGMLPIIRVADAEENTIGKALDIGAMGVQVPQVSDTKTAKAVVAAAKFHPAGSRGMCRFVRAAQYSTLDRYDYFREANEILVILQLEGQEAIDNLHSILAVEGVDILFIGPYDLSQSLGLPGQIDHPKVIEKMNEIVSAARAAGKVVGTFLDKPVHFSRWKQAGVQYLSYSTDVGLFAEMCASVVKTSTE